MRLPSPGFSVVTAASIALATMTSRHLRVHSMRSRVFVTVSCPSVRPSVRQSVCPIVWLQELRRAAGLLLITVVCSRYQSTAACAVLQTPPALSSKCGQRRVESRRRRRSIGGSRIFLEGVTLETLASEALRGSGLTGE